MSRRILIDALARDLWHRGDLNDVECLSIAEYLVGKGWILPQTPEPERIMQTMVVPKVEINLTPVTQTAVNPTGRVNPSKITKMGPLYG